jgi:BlaI family transcriptional regulator, penicillinase repressor
MPKSARDVPPPLELLCLRALWSLNEGNVKDVQRIVAESRPLAYTTIMTVLDRLVRKGKLTRRKVGRAFVYCPEASRDSMRQAALRELLDNFFDGSESELLRFLGKTDIVPVPPLAASVGAGAGVSAAAPVAAQEDSHIETVLL